LSEEIKAFLHVRNDLSYARSLERSGRS
jgi:hypothetical protein